MSTNHFIAVLAIIGSLLIIAAAVLGTTSAGC
jgi:hypothetical protein